VKQALKALHLDREPPAYVDEHDADAFLLACGLPVSKLATLKVTFGERLVSRGDLFSKTKAAHRCVEPKGPHLTRTDSAPRFSFLHDEPVVSWEGEGEHTVIMVRLARPPGAVVRHAGTHWSARLTRPAPPPSSTPTRPSARVMAARQASAAPGSTG
jgi:hypothetical protein